MSNNTSPLLPHPLYNLYYCFWMLITHCQVQDHRLETNDNFHFCIIWIHSPKAVQFLCFHTIQNKQKGAAFIPSSCLWSFHAIKSFFLYIFLCHYLSPLNLLLMGKDNDTLWNASSHRLIFPSPLLGSLRCSFPFFFIPSFSYDLLHFSVTKSTHKT